MTKAVPIQHIATSERVHRNIRDHAASRMQEVVVNFALCNALFAFVESKLWSDLKEVGGIDAESSAARHGYLKAHVLGLLRFLATQNVFSERELFYLTPHGEAVLSEPAVAHLRLHRGGYGSLMFDARGLMEGRVEYGKDLVRDGRSVALGSSGMTSSFHDEVPLWVLEKLGVRTLVDLGCGAGGFLRAFLRRNPEHRAVGVDNDKGALEAATEALQKEGLSDRVELVHGDAFDPTTFVGRCGKAEAVYSYAMEHELLRNGEDAVLQHIDSLAQHLPGRRFLLGEPMSNRNATDGAFYWCHVLSEQGLQMNLVAWTQLLGKLTRARLEHIYRPDHERSAAYFSLAL